jgi:hypothetical protein
VGGVIGRWAQIVGPELAEHARPETFDDGVLVVRAELDVLGRLKLRLLSGTLLARIAEGDRPGVVTELQDSRSDRPDLAPRPARRHRRPRPARHLWLRRSQGGCRCSGPRWRHHSGKAGDMSRCTIVPPHILERLAHAADADIAASAREALLDADRRLIGRRGHLAPDRVSAGRPRLPLSTIEGGPVRLISDAQSTPRPCRARRCAGEGDPGDR